MNRIVNMYLLILLLYCIGALCAWDLDPGNWHTEGRIFLIVTWVIVEFAGDIIKKWIASEFKQEK